MYNGIINIYKEKGFTSHDVVAKLRGILKQKKIGHTGTLDPDATGVLPVCLGSGTRLCDMLTDKTKEYEAVMLLGITTDTEDSSGEVLTRQEVNATEAEVINSIKSFIGEYNQVPPMYSAIKVDGRKLYELAREGRIIERKPRPVIINSIQIISMDLPRITIKVECGKGTYIRSLCRDIGEQLGCGACMEKLIRTRSGNFRIEAAHTLGEIEKFVCDNTIDDVIFPVDSVFMEYPSVNVTGRNAVLVSNGNKFPADSDMPSGMVRVYRGECFAGVYEACRDGFYKPVKMFQNGE